MSRTGLRKDTLSGLNFDITPDSTFNQMVLNFITHGIASVFAICLAVTLGIFTRTVTITPSQTAVVSQTAIPSSTMDTVTDSGASTSASATPGATAGLRGHVHVPKNISAASSSPTTTNAGAQTKNNISSPQSVSAPTPTPETPPARVTAEWLLERTTLSLTSKIDGTYKLGFTTNAGTAGSFAWDLGTSVVGGTGAIPQFKPSAACIDPPDLAQPDASDESPSFKVRTSYICNIALTALTGNDKRTQTKQFTFQTGPGRIVVTLASNINTLLRDGENDGGFVFNNQDNVPITIAHLTLNVSFTALSTSSNPLVVRFKNPSDDTTMSEYHLENIPSDPIAPYTQSQTGVSIPISFTIPAHTQRLLPANIFGVQKFAFAGINPSVNISLTGIIATPSDTKVILQAPQIIWTCVVPSGAYDPNATSSPFVTGQACRN